MRLVADGITPTSRLVLVEDLETDNGHAFELASPLLLAVGDRIGFEGGRLAVVRASGDRLTLVGDWSTRCGLRAGRRQKGLGLFPAANVERRIEHDRPDGYSPDVEAASG
ncbi:hypothetical protein [Streptomyces sp. A1547]|uniref:hypothetical protein n=1 Tax=Streptomyces sp. A1547 TaxID=2563105 RepID=UPI00061F7F3F|nr:hypothetical protein [Streptomyces sp. A1547]KJY41855.1 hypothetical protein VR46_24025 [Streptomyces sp. NRRL S-444]THA28787.1 hypothetical protein E6W17_40385 [Streptomyces sp. A1547]